MPHIDELLGVATIAAAGLFAAIALQPLPRELPPERTTTTQQSAFTTAPIASPRGDAGA